MIALLYFIIIGCVGGSIGLLVYGHIFATAPVNHLWTWYYLLLGGAVIASAVLVLLRRKKNSEIKHPRLLMTGRVLASILAIILLFNDVLWNVGFKFYKTYYRTVGITEVMLHLRMGTGGANMGPFIPVIVFAIVLFLVLTAVFLFVVHITKKTGRHVAVIAVTCLLSLSLIARGVLLLYDGMGVKGYLATKDLRSTFIEDNYVMGDSVDITFPEKKRNLVFIYLESMEMSLADDSVGGGLSYNVIPNLTQIGLDNVDFSAPGVLNGGYSVYGAGFTAGALVATTAGVGVKEDYVGQAALSVLWDEDVHMDYLPYAYTLGDVLDANGYHQEFLLGSDADYAGRGLYFRNHGNYQIEGYWEAMDQGRIPQGYQVWWGYEDQKLYQFAKEDLLKLAAGDEPFNLTMLTVDTHFTDGYVCELCEDEYDIQGLNVFACADRQLSDFIGWIQEQDFYDNTTIVIVGDHTSMDYAVMSGAGISDDYPRRFYTVIINPAIEYEEQQRVYTSMDMFPTTIAALGATIEGERLGLGTNLFSDVPTLAEEYGIGEMNNQLYQVSDYYENVLIGAEAGSWLHR